MPSLTISCKRYNCCLERNGLETCFERSEFHCDIYGNLFDWDGSVSHRVCLRNLGRIKEAGLAGWLREQKRKRGSENLLANYNEGKSCSFSCLVAALLPVESITRSVRQAETTMAAERTRAGDIRSMPKTVPSAVEEHATKAGIDLKLRKGSK